MIYYILYLYNIYIMTIYLMICIYIHFIINQNNKITSINMYDTISRPSSTSKPNIIIVIL